MKRIVVLATLGIGTIAHADSYVDPNPDELEVEGREVRRDPDGYVASGGVTGTFGDNEFNQHGLIVEGGLRLGRTPLFARAMGQFGNLRRDDNPGRGTYLQGRVGGEARTCLNNGMVCFAFGIDVGLHRGRYEWVDVGVGGVLAKPADQPSFELPYAELDAVLVAPRLTVDGGGRVRVRGVLERPSLTVDGGKRIDGFAASLTLGLAF